MVTNEFDASAYMGLCLSFWVILSTAQAAYKRVTERGLSQVGQAYWGMVLAHLGVAATVIGIAVSTAYGVEDDVQMAPGKSIFTWLLYRVYAPITAYWPKLQRH